MLAMAQEAMRRYEPDYVYPEPVLRHGSVQGRNGYDDQGAREPFLFAHEGRFYLHYDGNGERHWTCCLAVSDDLLHWEKKGRKLEVGPQGSYDAAGACYGPTYLFDGKWYLYYVSVQNTSGAPFYVPSMPYRTGLAVSDHPEGPWTKVSDNLFPMGEPGSWNEGCVCAPYIVRQGDTYYAFYSACNFTEPFYRTIGLAEAKSPEGPWVHREAPLLPVEEQLENPVLYYEPACGLWFMFVNHVYKGDRGEYTDAVWVYWSESLTAWNAQDKAVALDVGNIPWAPQYVGLPSGLVAGGKLWIAFDASGETGSRENLGGHMHRDIGMSCFDLPLRRP